MYLYICLALVVALIGCVSGSEAELFIMRKLEEDD